MKNDTLLVSRAVLWGDRRAFNRLVELYQSPVRRFLKNLTCDEELSKDLAQETFLKAWINIGSFRAASRFSTWLYRIAYNTFYDSIRVNKHLYGCENICQQPAESKDNDASMDIAGAFAVLKEDERTAVLLFYMEDQTIANISRIMGCPDGTIKSHLSRAKKKLALYLQGSGYENYPGKGGEKNE